MSENILSSELDYTLISLISKKIKVLIVGGGRAGFIKAKSFSLSGCDVYVVSKEFCDDFRKIDYQANLYLMEGTYNIEYIMDKHIIVIATGDEETDMHIASDCEKYSKLYLYCKDYKLGNLVKPLQKETNSIIFGVHSKSGNPNASRFIAESIQKDIAKQDDFISYLNSLRAKVKDEPYKDELMKFVTTEDFYFFYRNNAAHIVLQMFYSH